MLPVTVEDPGTDPDARAATSAKGSGLVGYNAQVAVDTESHLIVTHDVTNECHDRNQLAPMAKEAKATLGRGQRCAPSPTRATSAVRRS